MVFHFAFLDKIFLYNPYPFGRHRTEDKGSSNKQGAKDEGLGGAVLKFQQMYVLISGCDHAAD